VKKRSTDGILSEPPRILDKSPMPLRDLAHLDAPTLAGLESAVARHRSLEEVLQFAFAHDTSIAEIVVQDEFTHDVVIPWRRGLHLVYDTT
jgi:hypothetical protein